MEQKKRDGKRKPGTKLLLILCLLVCIMMPQMVLASEGIQGTEGNELQILEPENLEIQLGAAWIGVEFQLKTDAGLYPGTILVDGDGVLRLEIGGSKSYILTCLGSPKEASKPVQASATTEGEDGTGENRKIESVSAAEGQEQTLELGETEPKEENAAGSDTDIPVLHIVLFAGGMVVSIGVLTAMRLLKKDRVLTGITISMMMSDFVPVLNKKET